MRKYLICKRTPDGIGVICTTNNLYKAKEITERGTALYELMYDNLGDYFVAAEGEKSWGKAFVNWNGKNYCEI